MICGEKKTGLNVGLLPEDILPLSDLINLYDERQGGEELLTANLFFSQCLNTDTEIYAGNQAPGGIPTLSTSHTYT